MTDEPSLQMVCYNHPGRQTYLRCNRCERPICSECAVQTPTGYRCRECVRGQQKTFETAHSLDYPLAFIIAAGLAFLGSYVARVMGFFTIFLAPIAGILVAEAVRLVTRRRRARGLYQMATVGAALGSLPLLVINAVQLLQLLGSGMPISLSLGYLWPLIWQGVYTALVSSTVFTRLAVIKIHRV